MTTQDWDDGERRTLGLQIGNDAPDRQRFLVLLNAAPDSIEFRLNEAFPSDRWVQVFDTALAEGLVREAPAVLSPGASLALDARSLTLFQHALRGAA